jgi:hypothetical protein
MQNEKCKMQNVSDASRRVISEVFPFCTLHFSFLTLHYHFAGWFRDCESTGKKCMTASERLIDLDRRTLSVLRAAVGGGLGA